MPQSGFTPVQTYSSSTPGNVPLAANLTNTTQGAELAINIADGKLFYKDASGNVQVLASKAGNINVSSLSFGTTGLTPSTATTGAITVAGVLNAANGGTGEAGTLTGILYGNGTSSYTVATTAQVLSLIGTLPVSNGGTGQTTFTAGQVLYGNGTSGLSTSANMTFDGSTLTTLNSAYTGTLTGGTGVVNLGSGQFYKDASGNVGIGDSSPSSNGKLSVIVPSIASYVASNAAWVGSNGTGAMRLWIANTAYAGAGANEPWLHSYQNINIGSDANINIKFLSGGERMRIDSSGNLLVGVTANDLIANRTTGFAVGPSLAGSQEMIIRASLGAKWSLTATSGTHMYFYSDNGSAAVSGGNISTNGSVTSFNVTSDYRLKQNIVSLQNSLNKVLQLKPCSYNFIEGNQYSEGFIAHELQEIIPQAVTGEKDAIDSEGKPVYQAVDASFLISHLVSAIQEQQALITDLQTRLTKAGL